MNRNALIAMSGGVDSSVAAALMCRDGYSCIGVTMKLYANEEVGVPREHSCCTLSDVEDARSVAEHLGMPYYVFNFTDDFARKVIDRFVSAYEEGATPNPCIDCNRFMKFEELYVRAKALGCDTIVTGHYARVAYDEGRKRWLLKKSCNEAKDQSYVLYFMTQEQLRHTQFPLGTFPDKEAVRAVAEDYGFLNARKHDSQDICFVQNGSYAEFIEQYTGKQYPPGEFVDREGRVLGQHKGLIRYTVGQRRGLGLALPAPMYVYRKDVERNQIVLAYAKDTRVRALTATAFNWIAYEAPEEPVRVTAKTRYHAKEAAASAEVNPDGSVRIVFDEPQRAAAIGQAVVLYEGELVAGGGTIAAVEEV